MTGAWLGVGGTMIALLLLAGALLPRPWQEYAWFSPSAVDDSENKASKFAANPGSAGKDEGASGGKDKDAGDKARGGGTKDKSSGEKGKDQAGKGDKDGKDGGAKSDRKDGKAGDKDKRDAGRQEDKSKKDASERRMGDQNKQAEAQKSSPSDSPPPSDGLASWEWLRSILKWLVFILLGVVVLLVLLRSGLGWMAGWSDWARKWLEAWNRFWARLFGGWGGGESDDEEEEDAERRAPAQPFSAFEDPFESGAAGRWTARELVRYTFAALEAWARERDLGRQDGETALEFCERLAQADPSLAADVRRLASLFARAAYAPGGMPANTTDAVRTFWQRLSATERRPMSVS
jgi:hypothetical protein